MWVSLLNHKNKLLRNFLEKVMFIHSAHFFVERILLQFNQRTFKFKIQLKLSMANCPKLGHFSSNKERLNKQSKLGIRIQQQGKIFEKQILPEIIGENKHCTCPI